MTCHDIKGCEGVQWRAKACIDVSRRAMVCQSDRSCLKANNGVSRRAMVW